ncbi:MAG TPA: VIT1/CCC1 transporter family protein [Streptosporangiaceae bacterium]|jgi:VIT1/CCC1 family predicted Fe2+/Mn2+ transporter|nr:VIT1/CCC1 transporter family protein [Streptosporangiaceae bacterium]
MTAQASPAGLHEQDADTQRPFEDAVEAAPAVTPDRSRPSQHPDASGGWRPAASGVMAGLVANASLIAGVSGGGAGRPVIVLTGLAGLAAGALALAAGEYAAVSSRNELVRAQARKQALELLLRPDAGEEALAEVLRSHGFGAELAGSVARQVAADPERALAVRLREEFGADHRQLPRPLTAATALLGSFAAGALIPLLPYLLSYSSLAAALALAAVAALAGGGLAARSAGRRAGRAVLRGALRQLLLGAAAVGITYLAVHLAATIAWPS